MLWIWLNFQFQIPGLKHYITGCVLQTDCDRQTTLQTLKTVSNHSYFVPASFCKEDVKFEVMTIAGVISCKSNTEYYAYCTNNGVVMK